MKSDTALLVIDLQIALLAEEPAPFEQVATLARVKRLQDRARAADVPVLFVRHIEDDYPEMQPGSPGFEITREVAPLPGETVVNKRACDSFYRTTLQDSLHRLGVNRIIITGMQTEYCIDTTSRAALSHGFEVTLAADGHLTRDDGLFTAAQTIAHHNQMLANLAHPDHRITVVPTDEITFE